MTDAASVGSWSDVGSLDRKSHFSLEKDELEAANHQEHLRLAGIVKGVHADLRRKYKKSDNDVEKIWLEHCQNKHVLSQYADAMHHLAVDHWSKNNQETRIDWCRDAVIEYFKQDGLKKVLEKEKRRKEILKEKVMNVDSLNAESVLEKHDNGDVKDDVNNSRVENIEDKIQEAVVEKSSDDREVESDSEKLHVNLSSLHGIDTSTSHEEDDVNTASKKHFIKREYNVVEVPLQGRIRLLDVGSCFNPFLAFQEFQPIGIDISPAEETVFHCDFLHLRTTDPLQVANDTMTAFINNLKDPIEWLPRECFHVVVFSLLLEYFPAPYQRWVSCQKAHELLMYNGILVIVTPDSSHQNRNAGMMKSWKIAIESLGFNRWRYVKQEHLHCMVFRKVVVTEQEKRESFLKGITADMLYIPQDFHEIPDEYSTSCDGYNYSYEDEQFFKDFTAHELPVLLSDSDENDE